MINLDQTREFYEMLQDGQLPDGMTLTKRPSLSPEGAFSIIYYLQEHLRIIPPYNKCIFCSDLYDSTGEESDTAMVFADGSLIDSVSDDVTIEILERYDGHEFCSMECLLDFLEEKAEEKAEEKVVDIDLMECSVVFSGVKSG